MLRDVAPDGVVGHVEHLPQQTSRLRPQPVHPALGTVREGHHSDAVVRSQEDLGIEAGEDPVVLEREVAPDLGAEESEAEAGDARIGSEVRCEHRREGLRLEHGAVLVPATAEEGGDVPSHVSRRRVDAPATSRDEVVLDDGFRSAGAELVAGGEPRPDPLGTDEIRVLHAEGFEDVRAEVRVERHPGDVLDDLTERREPVVGVAERGPRIGVVAEGTPVELGERRHPPTELHRLTEIPHPQ